MKKTISALTAVATAGAIAFVGAPVDAAHGLGGQTVGMNAAQEVDGNGDRTGGEKTGSGKISLEFYGPGNGIDSPHVCYELTTRRVGDRTGLHIHTGERGTAGGVVVNLGAAVDTPDGLCVVGVEQGVIDAILADGAGYYVNYHTAAAPGGAIRGQLDAFDS